MKTETKNLLITIIILVGLTIIFWDPIINIISEPEKTRAFVSQFGLLAPIVFIFISIMQTVIAPIPGQLTGASGGFIFGIIFGTIYSLIGVTIGSYIVLVLSRKLGRPFVEKHVDKQTLEKFDKVLQEGGIPVIFAIFLLPFFPDDIILYIIGITNLKIRDVMIATTIARIPTYIILSSIGAGIAYNNPIIYTIIGVLVIISIILYTNKEKIEKRMFKK